MTCRRCNVCGYLVCEEICGNCGTVEGELSCRTLHSAPIQNDVQKEKTAIRQQPKVR